MQTNSWQNIYYGTLYAYTPEVLPSAHRGTGNGIAIGLNRIMGIMSAVIATYADVSLPSCRAITALILTTADEHTGSDIYLRSSLCRHGDCICMLPIRADGQQELLISFETSIRNVPAT